MKTALVTGSAKRIGRAIAMALAEDGYDLYLHYNRSEAEAGQLAQEIETLGRRALPVRADLADAGQAEALADKCTQFGPPTCLVNNAALYEKDAIADFTAVGFDRQLAVNLRAPLLLSQAFAALLPEGEAGVIINMLDFKIVALPARFLSYTIAKSALAAATEMLALALAPRIRVCGIAPGLVLQSPYESAETYDSLRRATPLQCGVEPADIVAALRYLVSAGTVTGQTIIVDAGQRFVSQRKPKSRYE